MNQASAASRSLTRGEFEAGIKTLKQSVQANTLKYKLLQMVDWSQAENSWALFERLRESGGFDKDVLRLWNKDFVNNTIGFQLTTRTFMVHLLLISFTRAETARGRRKAGKAKDPAKKAQIVKRTSSRFFFSPEEEDKRLLRVLWNLRKYFHVDIADSGASALTTIFHPHLSTVHDWNDGEQVTSFLTAIRPSKSAGGESPTKRGKSGRKPNAQKTRGKCVIKSEPSSWSGSDSDLENYSCISSEESSSQEAVGDATTYMKQSRAYDHMVLDCPNEQIAANYGVGNFGNIRESIQFPQEFMPSAANGLTYNDVYLRCMDVLSHLFSTNDPERIQQFTDWLGLYGPVPAPIEFPSGNFV